MVRVESSGGLAAGDADSASARAPRASPSSRAGQGAASRMKSGGLPCAGCGTLIAVERLDGVGDGPDMMRPRCAYPGDVVPWFGFNRTDDKRTEVVVCCSEGCAQKLTKGP